jgi:type II secretory pathway predicted ATPase ExeA
MTDQDSNIPPSKLIAILRTYFRPFQPKTAPLDSVGKSRLDVHFFDLSAIRLRLFQPVPFVFSARLAGVRINWDVFEEVYADVQRFKAGDPTRSAIPVLFLVVGGDTSQITPMRRADMLNSSVCILGQSDLERLTSAKIKTQNQLIDALAVALRRDLYLPTLHPYQPLHPAYGGAFFGRQEELAQLTRGDQRASAIILGNRRMGKTSLLMELRRRLVSEYNIHCTQIISGLTRCSPEEVCEAIVTDLLGATRATAHVTMAELPERIAKASESTGTKYAIMIDELDKLIEKDEPRDWPVLNSLRVIAQHHGDKCRIFMAGFRLARAKLDDLSPKNPPLPNFGAQRIFVSRLDRPERKEMIEKPLRLLFGTDIPPALFNVIDRATAGMPELIQICCRDIVNWFAREKTLPSADHFDKWIFSSEDYRDAVQYTFIRNTNEYERLVILLLIQEARRLRQNLEQYRFQKENVADLVRKNDLPTLRVVVLEDILRNLTTASIVERVEDGNDLRFSLPSLGRWYSNDESIEVAMAEALRDVDLSVTGEPWLADPKWEGKRSELSGSDVT